MVLVKVYDGRRKTYRYRKDLKKLGFRFSETPEAHWWIEASEDEVGRMEDWCFERRLEIETPYSRRSGDYRKVFLEANGPNFGRDRYLCVYCGFPIRQDKVTVDHLIAVKKAQRSRYYLGLLRKWGCASVNDVLNLVPCCRRCNSRKGTKAGIWVIRGLLGRKRWFLALMWLVYVFIIIGLGVLGIIALKQC